MATETQDKVIAATAVYTFNKETDSARRIGRSKGGETHFGSLYLPIGMFDEDTEFDVIITPRK